MQLQKCNLNWHTYSDHLREMLHEMMKSDYLTDITLVTDDRVHLKAHKIVLSACSVVFKSIINEIPENSVIYLRGIQYQEMKSILEFMYLGLATFDRNRIDEFMKVAKNLEIKVISENFEFDTSQDNMESKNIENIEQRRNESITERKEHSKETEWKEHSRETEFDTSQDNLESTNVDKRQNGSSIDTERKDDSLKLQEKDDSFELDRKESIGTEWIEEDFRIVKYKLPKCPECNKKFSSFPNMSRHFESKHKGIKFKCNLCSRQFTTQDALAIHTKSIHFGVKFPCNQCDYQATQKFTLTTHIRKHHEGVK